MSMMMGSLYDALRQAGAPDDVARRAAEEVARDAPLAALETRVGHLERKMDVLTWMVGANVALSVGILVRLLSA